MLIYGYKFGSASSKALSASLGARRIRHMNSGLIGRASKRVINWGASELPPEVAKCTIVNEPHRVAIAANKLSFFNFIHQHNMNDGIIRLATVSIPPFTTDKTQAQLWMHDGRAVVERHKLTGNSGEGIVICPADGELGDAPLYTQYINKNQEYRVHYAFGEVIDVQRKARSTAFADEDVNWKIRNTANGFIYAREDGVYPTDIVTQASRAVEALGLDFGAVDVIFNDNRNKAYVLEVNTAPGLTGTTLANYTEAFNAYS